MFFAGSVSSNIADKIAKELLKAIEEDGKTQ